MLTHGLNIIEQRTDEWFAARLGNPSASQFSRIVTPDGKPSKQADDYLLQLAVELATGQREEIPMTKDMRRGVEQEPEAFELFRDNIPDLIGDGYTLTEGNIWWHDEMKCAASPDGIILDPNGKPFAGLEIKCPNSLNHAKYVRDFCLPSQYSPQVYGSMAVTEIPKWYFMSYHRDMVPMIIEVNHCEVSLAMVKVLKDFGNRRKEIEELAERLRK